MRRRLLMGLFLAALSVAGAAAPPAGKAVPGPATAGAWLPGKAAAPPALTVFAAASLKESLDAAATAWSAHSKQKVVVSYAASSALAKQIEQDAPADIFISADGGWMDYLQSRKRIDTASRFNLVGNQLVLVAPATSSLRVIDLRRKDAMMSALGDGRLSIAETGSVPAGRYARQSLTKLGLWNSVADHLAQADNVRGALAFVARGEATLGIVYATDAKAEPKVLVLAVFPASSHDPIIYPAALVASPTRSARASEGAKRFLAFLRSAEAREIFRQAGFSRR